jgi:HEAT repeat-containing protein 5
VFDILLPVIGLLLQHAQTHSSALKSQTVSQLLLFATSSPLAFKEAAGKLDSVTKEILEQALRCAVGEVTSKGQNVAKPAISLKSF